MVKEIWKRHFNQADVIYLYSLCREHYAHLYGPATLIEDKQTLVLHADDMDDLPPPPSTRSSVRKSNMFPGVELRDKLKSHLEHDKKTTTGTLRRAFSTNAYHKVTSQHVSFVICALLQESQFNKQN
jgi:hypothetical protein